MNKNDLGSALASINAATQPTPLAADPGDGIHPHLPGLLRAAGLDIVEEARLEGRGMVSGPIPATLHPRVREYLQAACPDGIYRHQSLALERFLAGEDVCLSTPTASGKSLVFIAAAAHRLLQDPEARVLVVLPARALVEDQRLKWLHAGEALGLEVGQVDGGVPWSQRLGILDRSRVVLCTPDVLQSWMLANVAETHATLRRCSLVIADELHVYQGAIGTNFAYLLRRLAIVLGSHQYIAATATIGDPAGFCRALTGRGMAMVGAEDNGAPSLPKRVMLCRPSRPGGRMDLLRALVDGHAGTFLAFDDSRTAVEDLAATVGQLQHVLSFRGGMESEHRREIQQALERRQLKGVVSTSALEIGIDFGDVDVVVLLGLPPSMQSFWQRIGRLRGRTPGAVILLDPTDSVRATLGGLAGYLSRPAEANPLYVENRFLAYANALCAARELADLGRRVDAWKNVEGVSTEFVSMLQNELDPTVPVPDELFPLKQRGQNSPHHQFPLRGGMEPGFCAKLAGAAPGSGLGTLTTSQWLREAYPGAVYLYMGRPYRVRGVNGSDVVCSPEPNRFARTRPDLQTMAFPSWTHDPFWRSGNAFVARAPLQVAERVNGFTEKIGRHSKPHAYGVGSPWSQRAITRFFPTTGVLVSMTTPLSEAAGTFLVDAYAQAEGIHARDIGLGFFSSPTSPDGGAASRGLAIYDNILGGLRLTEKLIEGFPRYLDEAVRLASLAGNAGATQLLTDLRREVEAFVCVAPHGPTGSTGPTASMVGVGDDGAESWVRVIAAGEKAYLVDGAQNTEVTVLDHVFSRDGVRYQLQHATPGIRWTVPIRQVQAIHGCTWVEFNPDTCETRPVSA